jgi:hypothetical protein
MPNQDGGTSPAVTTADVVDDRGQRTVLGPGQPRPVTTKSSYNRMAGLRA